MTTTAARHQELCKDQQVDRRVDVQIDAGKAASKDDGARTQAGFVIVLANHKGGVTKTTSTANLGAMFAEAGRRVLMVDCDPQANLSEAFGWTEEVPGERLEDLLTHPDAAHRYTPPAALQPGVAPQLAWRELLRIIPSTDALADVAADLPGIVGDGYENRLGEVLNPLRSQFDLVLLDTPPGRGNLSGMAVLAADGLLIPALAADLDVRGAGKLYDLVEGEIPGLRILGVLIAASEPRWRITRDAGTRMQADEMRVVPVRVPTPSGSPRRRATGRRPRCWSRTRWSATPTDSSLATFSRRSPDERRAGDAPSQTSTDTRDEPRPPCSPAVRADELRDQASEPTHKLVTGAGCAGPRGSVDAAHATVGALCRADEWRSSCSSPGWREWGSRSTSCG